ncbi:MAG: hypothetical protein ACI9S9_002991 [Planctomycetota bacterium]|jgi:hypothetical protein
MAPAVINRIMDISRVWGPRRMSAGAEILRERCGLIQLGCLVARGSPKVAPTGSARNDDCSTWKCGRP